MDCVVCMYRRPCVVGLSRPQKGVVKLYSKCEAACRSVEGGSHGSRPEGGMFVHKRPHVPPCGV